MELVEVAQFYDLTEAQVAASAVRSAGIDVHVQNEHWGQVEAYMQHAIGGFSLWVPEADAPAVRDFIAEQRAAWTAPEREGSVATAAVGVSLMLLLGPAAGWLVAKFRKSRLDP